jgi:hypothetical protein
MTFSDVITVKSLDGSSTHRAGQKIEVPSISSLTDDPSNIETKRETSRYAREGKFAGVKNKKLTFQRSPLIKNEVVGLKPKQPEKKPLFEELEEEEVIEVDRYAVLEEKRLHEKQSSLHNMLTRSEPPPKTEPLPSFIKEDSITPEEERLNYEAELLHKTILALGKNLSMDNCRTFIQQIQLKLNKDVLNEQDIANAAQLYVKKLEDRKKFTES